MKVLGIFLDHVFTYWHSITNYKETAKLVNLYVLFSPLQTVLVSQKL